MSDVGLNRALRIMSAFREIDPDMPTSTAAVFLAIALKPGMAVLEAMEAPLNLSRGAASRAFSRLGDGDSKETSAGLGLIVVRAEDARRKPAELTKKGARLLNKIDNIVGE